MPVPCWRKWRKGRSSMSSLTALTKHQLMFSSRWITCTSASLWATEGSATRHIKWKFDQISNVDFLSSMEKKASKSLFWIAVGLIFTTCKISALLSPSEILCSLPNPSRAYFWARRTRLEPTAARKINWRHFTNRRKLWHILTRIVVNVSQRNMRQFRKWME